MWHCKKFIMTIGLILLVILTTTLLNGCYKMPNPVHFIEISKARLTVPASFGEGAWIRPPEPHPDFIQGAFSPGDKIYLGLAISKEIKKNVTFSRYTFYNKRTGYEIEIGRPEDLGPFEPGQITLVAFYDPWVVPEQPDTYEVRIYIDNGVVASALFEVK